MLMYVVLEWINVCIYKCGIVGIEVCISQISE